MSVRTSRNKTAVFNPFPAERLAFSACFSQSRISGLQAMFVFAAFLCLIASVEGQVHAPATPTSHHSPPPAVRHHPPPLHRRPIAHHPPPPRFTHVDNLKGANITLVNMTIYDKHAGWLDVGTDVYFRCEGENKRFLQPVKDVNHLYQFHGRETFQPLTKIQAGQCKKCGLYEKDTWSSDDVFAEWRICTQNFTGKYSLFNVYFRDQFDAVLHCADCKRTAQAGSDVRDAGHAYTVVFILFLLFLALLLVFGVLLALFLLKQRYVDKVKKEETVRFMALFDEDEDLESLEDERL